MVSLIIPDREVSERKERERDLQRERDRFRAVIEDAFDAMVIADDDGQYIDVNESAIGLFGLPEEELFGRSVDEFAPEEFDFDGALQEFRASERERGRFSLVRPDGEERMVKYVGTMDIVPGQHLSVLRDITGQIDQE